MRPPRRSVLLFHVKHLLYKIKSIEDKKLLTYPIYGGYNINNEGKNNAGITENRTPERQTRRARL